MTDTTHRDGNCRKLWQLPQNRCQFFYFSLSVNWSNMWNLCDVKFVRGRSQCCLSVVEEAIFGEICSNFWSNLQNWTGSSLRDRRHNTRKNEIFVCIFRTPFWQVMISYDAYQLIYSLSKLCLFKMIKKRVDHKFHGSFAFCILQQRSQICYFK